MYNSCMKTGLKLCNLRPIGKYLSIYLVGCVKKSSRHYIVNSHGRSIRKVLCGELKVDDSGSLVEISGHIQKQSHGRLLFLRDNTGHIQLALPEDKIDIQRRLQNVPLDSYLIVRGLVTTQIDKFRNEIEVKDVRAQKQNSLSVHPKERRVVETENIKILVESLLVTSPKGSAPPKVSDNNEGSDNGDGIYKKVKHVIVNADDSKENLVSGPVVPDTNKYTSRTHTCGELDDTLIGKNVKLMGWVELSRMNKFIVLRDGYGKIQLFIPDQMDDVQKTVGNISFESVISVEGVVCPRPQGSENPKQKMGTIEVMVTDLKVLNMAKKKLPFYVRDFNKPATETLRLQYRYLDLRYENMQRNLRVRSKTLHKMRNFLIENLNFVEVETPTLFKRTPGGAQEFIVPTQTKGKFYSLVQSPQQFKQLLMIGSIDRYFQIAHCYRDETSERDRQPEFTQLDIEMSFCERTDVINLVEDLLKYCWPESETPLITPFPRISYEEAMDTYGTDKPDLRFDWKFQNFTSLFLNEKNNFNGKYKVKDFFTDDDFATFAFVGRKGAAKFSASTKNKMRDKICSEYPNTDFMFFPIKSLKTTREQLESIFCSSVACEIEKRSEYETGDVLFLAIGQKNDVVESLGKLRVRFAEHLEANEIDVVEKNAFRFAWIYDFPLFEHKNGSIKSAHHPFTKPHPEDVHLLESDPLKVKGLHYDLVLNGHEIGGGSIRIENCELQKMILEKILKIDSKCLSHLLEGLESGAPPHGGIALGIDRLIAILCGTSSIREVMAFPKSGYGNDLMSGAPSDIPQKEKLLYHIRND